MTFGTTVGKTWTEALPTRRGAQFTGRTFSRFHIVSDSGAVSSVGEIWATSDHAVESHAHDSDELLYVLSGAIEVNGQKLGINDVVFIPKGTSYSARVLADEGSHILRIDMANADRHAEVSEYDARDWEGPLTNEGVPHLGKSAAE